jgi:hypothetical protein
LWTTPRRSSLFAQLDVLASHPSCIQVSIPQRYRDGTMTMLDVLFAPPEVQWGLRGDPHVWELMRVDLSDVRVPPVADVTIRLVHESFSRVVGVDLQDADLPPHVFRQELDHGGMSGGHVSIEAWRERLMPLLEQRARQLSAST